MKRIVWIAISAWIVYGIDVYFHKNILLPVDIFPGQSKITASVQTWVSIQTWILDQTWASDDIDVQHLLLWTWEVLGYTPSQQTFFLKKQLEQNFEISVYQQLLQSQQQDAAYEDMRKTCLQYQKFDLMCVMWWLNVRDLTPEHLQTYRAYLETNKASLGSEYDMIQRLLDIQTWSIQKLDTIDHPLAKKLRLQLNQYFAFKSPPDSYAYGLIGSVLVQEWYYTLTQQVSYKALATSPNYILAYQTLAYVWLFAQRPDVGIPALKKLLEIDPDHTQLYYLLYGVQSYHAQEYTQAVFFLNQVSTKKLEWYVQRYLALSYAQLSNRNKMNEIYDMLILYPNDYQEYFDTVRKNYERWSPHPFVPNPTFERLLTTCTGGHCAYGKLINTIINWQKPEILPTSDYRVMIIYWDRLSKNWDPIEAKKRRYRALRSTYKYDTIQSLTSLLSI